MSKEKDPRYVWVSFRVEEESGIGTVRVKSALGFLNFRRGEYVRAEDLTFPPVPAETPGALGEYTGGSLTLNWTQRLDGYWNADCPCGSALVGWEAKNRGYAERQHRRFGEKHKGEKCEDSILPSEPAEPRACCVDMRMRAAMAVTSFFEDLPGVDGRDEIAEDLRSAILRLPTPKDAP